jgi:hypothetical protein
MLNLTKLETLRDVAKIETNEAFVAELAGDASLGDALTIAYEDEDSEGGANDIEVETATVVTGKRLVVLVYDMSMKSVRIYDMSDDIIVYEVDGKFYVSMDDAEQFC